MGMFNAPASGRLTATVFMFLLTMAGLVRGDETADSAEKKGTGPVNEKRGLESFYRNENGTGRFSIFSDTFLPTWGTTQWGGLFCEKSSTCAKEGHDGLRLKTRDGARAYGGVTLRTLALNRRLDCSGFEPDRSYLQLWMNSPIGLQIKLGNGGTKTEYVIVDSKHFSQREGDWSLLRIPLREWIREGSLNDLHSISIQTRELLPKEKQILLDEICLITESKNAQIPTTGKLPDSITAEIREVCGTDEVFTEDEFERPIIENGTFYMHGKPVFFLGPWTSTGSLALDWGPGTERDCLKDPLYDRYYDKETAGILGMNSMQHSCALLTGAEMELGTPVTKRTIECTHGFAEYLKGLQGMPVIMDFAFAGEMYKSLINEGRIPPEAEQNNSAWHEFVYLCPECPDGRKAYHSYFRNGARATLKNGGNPYAWEIYNESSYNCRCAYNRSTFAEKMKTHYGDIASANRQWGTDFASFTTTAQVPQFENYPGLWIDWCKFSGDRYAEILQEQKGVIREVDKRERVYFLEQIALSNLWKYCGAGMDYRKIAAVTDILGTEGGWGFGRELSLGQNQGNAMEAALATHGAMYSYALDTFRAVAKNEKPVVNVEHYCGRKLFGKRDPSHPEDITTAMWSEVFHGVSGSYMYAWCKRVWEWKTYEDGRKMVLNGGYKSHHLLVPYAYPRESLEGFRVFSDELDQVRDIALPMPRLRQATVALMHSYPTLRMSPISQMDTGARIGATYGALLFSQYPLDILMEEDIPAISLSRYQAIVLPFAENTYPETLPMLKEYVTNGGILLCMGGAFEQTEYGKPLDASEFLGLTRERIKPEIKTTPVSDGTQIMVRQLFAVTPSTAKCLDGGVLFVNRLGAGKVYYLAGEASRENMKKILRISLAGNGVKKHGELIAEEGDDLGNAEFQVIDRRDRKLMMLVNWIDHGSRLVRLKLNVGNGGYLFDPFTKTLYASPGGGEVWNEEDLKNGVRLILPPQERVILMLQETPPLQVSSALLQNEVGTNFARIREQEKPDLDRLDLQEREIVAARHTARFFEDVRTDKCFSIDISKQANMEFKDEIDGDHKGGWFDQGANDFRDMPLGRQILANVPFEIIDPKTNNNRSAIILYGPARNYFPAKVEGIPVNRSAKCLYFLHGAGWGTKEGELCHSYVVNYSDGSNTEVEVLFLRHISGWWSPLAVPEAKIALEGANLLHGRIGLYAMRWENPHPDREIASIDVIASKNNVVPAVVAITGETP